MLLGGQLMSMGFLAELFIAYHDAAISKPYSIAERTAGREQPHVPETPPPHPAEAKP